MAAVTSIMQASVIGALGCRNSSFLSQDGSRLSRGVNASRRPRSYGSSRKANVRCDARNDKGSVIPEGLLEVFDSFTKKTITREEILHNQETNTSEQKSVFGVNPKGRLIYGRPEIERRPETGNRDFVGVFAFDGAAPETINGRLAMLGFVWAFFAEKATGLTVGQQVFSPGATGLVFFVGAIQLLTYASLVPIINGESTDARRFGPFTARAERWNGRLAMIGFAALLIDEVIRQSPVFH